MNGYDHEEQQPEENLQEISHRFQLYQISTSLNQEEKKDHESILVVVDGKFQDGSSTIDDPPMAVLPTASCTVVKAGEWCDLESNLEAMKLTEVPEDAMDDDDMTCVVDNRFRPDGNNGYCSI